MPVSDFPTRYRPFIKRNQRSSAKAGFDIHKMAAIEPLLRFLYKDWWRVQISGLERLPEDDPALIVGNYSGLLPWTALMLMYALMCDEHNPRRVSVVADLDWVDDERLYSYLTDIGFVPWSSANMKQLFNSSELVAIFPEGLPATGKPHAERHRLREFDWTKFLPAVEEGIEIFPLATYGCDDSAPVLLNFDRISKLLSLPTHPVSPFFPFLPLPVNKPLPVRWKMSMMRSTKYETGGNRDQIEDTTKHHARYVEGEIQAELNRILRSRTKSYI